MGVQKLLKNPTMGFVGGTRQNHRSDYLPLSSQRVGIGRRAVVVLIHTFLFLLITGTELSRREKVRRDKALLLSLSLCRGFIMWYVISKVFMAFPNCHILPLYCPWFVHDDKTCFYWSNDWIHKQIQHQILHITSREAQKLLLLRIWKEDTAQW